MKNTEMPVKTVETVEKITTVQINGKSIRKIPLNGSQAHTLKRQKRRKSAIESAEELLQAYKAQLISLFGSDCDLVIRDKVFGEITLLTIREQKTPAKFDFAGLMSQHPEIYAKFSGVNGKTDVIRFK